MLYDLFRNIGKKTSKPNKLRVAVLLNSVGGDCIERFNSFKLATADADKYDFVIEHFNCYFESKKNTVIAHYKLFNCVQQQNETVGSFVTNLENLPKDCCFEN